MIKCLFLIGNLEGGGAERVLVNLVNNMDTSKFDITVETIFSDGVHRKELSPFVHYKCRKAPYFKGITKLFRFIPAPILYKWIVGKTHYDIVIAYMHGVPTHIISGCRDKSIKKVTWIHNGDMDHTSLFDSFPSYKSAIRALSSFDQIVPVAQSIADALKEKTGISDNVTVCYNTNNIAEIIRLSKEPVNLKCNKPVVCSVGRFTPDKGFERLINMSHRLHKEGYAHTLLLVGAGKDFEKTKKLASDLGEDVVFTGFDINPYKYMKASDLFVCSSFIEGMCTASVEALVLGRASISTDVSGAKEILGFNNEYGIVTKMDDDSPYEGLKKMISDPSLIKYYSKKALESSSKFSTESTVKSVEDLLESVLAK